MKPAARTQRQPAVNSGKLVAKPRKPGRRTPSPAPPPRPGALSDRELYQTWLRLAAVPEPMWIVGWPAVWSACCDAGVARLGGSYYAPGVWRRLVQRAVKRGEVIPFWWKAKGRPPHIITTWQHIAAWALAGFHRRLRATSRERAG